MVLFWKRKKAYIAGLSRDQLEHLASPMTKSESKYQRVQDKSETIENRLESGLEYYSPTRAGNRFQKESIPRRWESRVDSKGWDRSHQEELTPHSEIFSVQQSLSMGASQNLISDLHW